MLDRGLNKRYDALQYIECKFGQKMSDLHHFILFDSYSDKTISYRDKTGFIISEESPFSEFYIYSTQKFLLREITFARMK